MRGSASFDDLAAYRWFIDEVIAAKNRRAATRIDAERVHLKPLPDRRTSDYEEVIVTVTSSSGFTLRKVFYTVPSRLIGHRLRVRLHDDRLDVLLGATRLMTLMRGISVGNGKHAQAETSVLFELISAHYEQRSMLITANQPFGAWNRIFPDPAMTLAAVDRLAHHATIFEMNVESYRRRTAVQRHTGARRPPTDATIKTAEQASPCDNQADT